MGGANSAERLQKFNTELSKIITSCGVYNINDLRNAVNQFAAVENAEEKKNFDTKHYLQKFTDPATKLNLLHFICFGDFVKSAADVANRDQLLKDLIDDRVFDDINCIDGASGRNALHYACARPLPHPPNKFSDNNTDIVQTLLAEGVSFNVQDKDGLTPLMLAADSMYPGSMKELVGRGASVGFVDNNGKNVFHYFILAFGSREYHKQIPEEVIVGTLETLTAVASAKDKELAVDGLTAHGQFAYSAIRKHFEEVETVSVDSARMHRAQPPGRDSNLIEPFPLTPLLLAIREYRAEPRYEFNLLRAATIKFFLKNGFGFYNPVGAFYQALKAGTAFFSSVNGTKNPVPVAVAAVAREEGEVETYLYESKYGAFLARLTEFDAKQLSYKDNVISVLPSQRGVIMRANINFEPPIFADDAERDTIASANPLIAAIVLNHFGIFSYMTEQGGFATLLNPVGPRKITPLHVLLGIRTDAAHESVQRYFVKRCLQFAFQVGSDGKYFEKIGNLQSVRYEDASSIGDFFRQIAGPIAESNHVSN